MVNTVSGLVLLTCLSGTLSRSPKTPESNTNNTTRHTYTDEPRLQFPRLERLPERQCLETCHEYHTRHKKKYCNTKLICQPVRKRQPLISYCTLNSSARPRRVSLRARGASTSATGPKLEQMQTQQTQHPPEQHPNALKAEPCRNDQQASALWRATDLVE